MKYHYSSLAEYHADDERGYLQAGDGATCEINGILFECLTNVRDDKCVVWVAWDSPERGGLRSYVSQQEVAELGLGRF